MATLDELVVKIKADTTQLEQALKGTAGSVKGSVGEMQSSLGSLKQELMSLLPAFSAVTLVAFGKSALESAENLTHMADRIGFTVQTLSALEPTLKKNGSSVDEFATSVNFLNRNLGLAASGNFPAIAKKFDELHLSVAKLMTMDDEQRFFAVARALGENADQAHLAADAYLLMGRGVAGLLPALKETKGDFTQVIEKARELGQVITPEQEKNIRAFEAAWVDLMTEMKVATLEAMTVLTPFIEAIKWLVEHRGDAMQAGLNAARFMQKSGGQTIKGQVLSGRPTTVSQATIGKGYTFDANGNLVPANPAASGNTQLGGTAGAVPAPPNPDDSALMKYIADLQNEAEAAGTSKVALAQMKAEIEAGTKARDDYDKGLRDSPLLYESEKKAVDDAVESLDAMKKAQEENAQMAALMKNQISGALADIAINFKSMGATVTSVIQTIAKEVIQLKITTPLANSISTFASGFDFSKIFGGGKATGGPVNSGTPYLIGEQGPELFVPNSAGTVMPSGSFGGSQIIVQQTFQIYPGAEEVFDAKMRVIAPSIAKAAHDSVFATIQRGGSEARLVGRRN